MPDPTWQGRTADHQQDAVQQVAKEGTEAFNAAKSRVAETLHQVAGAVRDSASQVTGGRSAKALADDAVEGLSDAAQYVRQTDTQAMWRDFSSFVRSQPAGSLAAAALVGFFVGRLARRE